MDWGAVAPPGLSSDVHKKVLSVTALIGVWEPRRTLVRIIRLRGGREGHFLLYQVPSGPKQGRAISSRDDPFFTDSALKGGSIPDQPQGEVRDVVWYRNRPFRKRAPKAHRIQKVLKGSNSNLTSIVSGVRGYMGQPLLVLFTGGKTTRVTSAV